VPFHFLSEPFADHCSFCVSTHFSRPMSVTSTESAFKLSRVIVLLSIIFAIFISVHLTTFSYGSKNARISQEGCVSPIRGNEMWKGTALKVRRSWRPRLHREHDFNFTYYNALSRSARQAHQ